MYDTLWIFLLNYIIPTDNAHELSDPFSGFPQALEIMENLENHYKSSMHGKVMEFEKTWIIMEKSWNFVK